MKHFSHSVSIAKSVIAAAFLSVVFLHQEAPSQQVAARTFRVTAGARQLNVGTGQRVTVKTAMSVPATETIVIKDLSGTVVRTLFAGKRPAGKYGDAWDGKSEGGRRLPDGQYLWVATFDDGRHRTTIDHSAELDGDVESKSHPEYGPWNPFDNVPLKFSHTFAKPGEILLIFSQATHRVEPSCDPPKYFCRQMEGFQPAGEFRYEWAGVDDTGAFRPDIHAISVISNHENLAKNAIVVHGGRPRITGVSVSPAYFRPDFGTQEVSFTLKTYRGEHVSATISFTNQESLSVLKTLRLEDVSPGLVKTRWDGRSDTAALVSPGKYTVTVWVTDSLGQRARGEILTSVDY